MVRLASAAAMLLLSVVGCGSESREATPPVPSPTPSEAPPGLLLDFESGLEVGADARTVANAGHGSIDAEVRAIAGGTVKVVPGRDGGHAARFPAFTGADDAPTAVLVAEDDLQGDLDPGADEFSFGASFRLDAKSAGSKADDGDNLLQRGSFDSPGQFKVQIDRGVPSCRILGDDGEVFVEAGGPVDPGAWYTVTCERSDADVELTVEPLDAGGGGGTWRGQGPTGAISLAALPFTVGGKAGPDGTPSGSADQFNGVVDDVFLRVE